MTKRLKTVQEHGVIYRGRDFTSEQFEHIKTLSRERGITMDEAIKLADAEAKASTA